MDYAKFEPISIRNHPELNEKWVQDRIAEDPSILGLGDIILKDRERIQPRAGRLDLLLQESDSFRRYEVEIQLGATDESHIIRTIEYWDIERKRYPQYDHVAVIIAEDITSRFLNVVNLFNGTIPLIAIQMRALQIDGKIGLFFTTVIDLLNLGFVDEDEATQEVTDRAYWENRGSKKTVAMADQLFAMARDHDPSFEMKYNKFYIGLARNGQPYNFVIFRPQKNLMRLEVKLKNTTENQEQFETSGLDVMEYDSRFGYFRIRLQLGDIEKNKEILRNIIASAYAAGGQK